MRPRWPATFLLLLACAATAAGGPPPVTTRPAESSESDWPAFGGGPAHRGRAGEGAGPTEANIAWSLKPHLAGARADYRLGRFLASPAVAGGRLFITSCEFGPFVDRGALHCIDIASGRELWQFTHRHFRATLSSPAVSGDYVVCGEGTHNTPNARVFCFDRRSGRKLWEFKTRSHVESSPAIAGGRVFVGAGDDGFYCFDLAPRGDGRARIRWHLPGSKYPDCESSPTVVEGVCYFGLGQGGSAIVAVRADDGRELWRVPTPAPVFGAATVADGRLYATMGVGTLRKSAEEIREREAERLRRAGRSPAQIEQATRDLGPRGEVWCLELPREADQPGRRPTVRWMFSAGRVIFGSVALRPATKDRPARLYCGSRDQHLYCLSTEGDPIARFRAAGAILASPALADDRVYVTDVTGRLHCLRADDLERLWSVRLGQPGIWFSSPAIAADRLLVGTDAGGVVCIGPPRPELSPED